MYRTPRYHSKVVFIPVLMFLFGCGNSADDPIRFNNAIINSTAKLEVAGQRFGKSLTAGFQNTPASRDALTHEYQTLKAVLKTVKSEISALKVPPGISAKTFYEASLAYLKVEDKAINQNMKQMVEIVLGTDSTQSKARQIIELFRTSVQEENKAFKAVQEGQKFFATDHRVELIQKPTNP